MTLLREAPVTDKSLNPSNWIAINGVRVVVRRKFISWPNWIINSGLTRARRRMISDVTRGEDKEQGRPMN